MCIDTLNTAGMVYAHIEHASTRILLNVDAKKIPNNLISSYVLYNFKSKVHDIINMSHDKANLNERMSATFA